MSVCKTLTGDPPSSASRGPSAPLHTVLSNSHVTYYSPTQLQIRVPSLSTLSFALSGRSCFSVYSTLTYSLKPLSLSEGRIICRLIQKYNNFPCEILYIVMESVLRPTHCPSFTKDRMTGTAFAHFHEN